MEPVTLKSCPKYPRKKRSRVDSARRVVIDLTIDSSASDSDSPPKKTAARKILLLLPSPPLQRPTPRPKHNAETSARGHAAQLNEIREVKRREWELHQKVGKKDGLVFKVVMDAQGRTLAGDEDRDNLMHLERVKDVFGASGTDLNGNWRFSGGGRGGFKIKTASATNTSNALFPGPTAKHNPASETHGKSVCFCASAHIDSLQNQRQQQSISSEEPTYNRESTSQPQRPKQTLDYPLQLASANPSPSATSVQLTVACSGSSLLLYDAESIPGALRVHLGASESSQAVGACWQNSATTLESGALIYPLDAIVVQQAREYYTQIHNDLIPHLYSPYRVDDPSSTIALNYTVFIDVEFFPSRMGTHSVRQQFSPIFIRLFSHADAVAWICRSRMGPEHARYREELLYHMGVEGMNEYNGLRDIPEEDVRCGVWLCIHPPLGVPGLSGALELIEAAVPVQKTDLKEWKGGDRTPWKFDERWKETLMERLKGDPMTRREYYAMEKAQRGLSS
ncbi:hypothetical protein P7C70_g5975, partial [Phenoliferia sp. Uapishka_3]